MFLSVYAVTQIKVTITIQFGTKRQSAMICVAKTTKTNKQRVLDIRDIKTTNNPRDRRTQRSYRFPNQNGNFKYVDEELEN